MQELRDLDEPLPQRPIVRPAPTPMPEARDAVRDTAPNAGLHHGWSFPRHRLIVAGAAAALLVAFGLLIIGVQPNEERVAVPPHNVKLTRAWHAFYERNSRFLGAPLWTGGWGDQKDCVNFEFHLVCHDTRSSVRGTHDEYPLAPLGQLRMPQTPTPQATRPDAFVQAYLDSLEQAGVPWRYWLGPSPLAPTFCISGGSGAPNDGQCVVFFRNTHLRWPKDGRIDQIERDPLGKAIPKP